MHRKSNNCDSKKSLLFAITHKISKLKKICTKVHFLSVLFRNFSVGNFQSNYRLNVTGYSGTAGKIRFKLFNLTLIVLCYNYRNFQCSTGDNTKAKIS